jgi:hypothetical protein
MKTKSKFNPLGVKFNPLGAAITLYFVIMLIAIAIFFGSKISHYLFNAY